MTVLVKLKRKYRPEGGSTRTDGKGVKGRRGGQGHSNSGHTGGKKLRGKPFPHTKAGHNGRSPS